MCRICWLHSRPPPRTRWWTQTKIVVNLWTLPTEHNSKVPTCLSEQFHVLSKAVFALNVNYIQLNYNSIYILHSILFNYGSVHIRENSNKLDFEVGLQPRTRSTGSNISHSCRWFPEILLPSRILWHFCLRLLILTRHCCALLEYPPSAIPWLIFSHTSLLLCMVFNSCCTASSLHKAIKSLVSSNHHVSANFVQSRTVITSNNPNPPWGCLKYL